MTDPLEAYAARMIIAREAGEWTGDDERQLADWLQSSARHQAIYWRLEQGWAEADRIRALGPEPTGMLGNRFRNSVRKVGIFLAASVMPLAAAWWLWEAQPPSPSLVFATEIGGRKLITLADGSTVDLNTDSRIRVQFSETARTIYLDRGEAYFDVAKASRRPFVVLSRDRRITDIGTRFLVRNTEGALLTAVAQGKVRLARLENGSPREEVLLSAGDRALAEGRRTLTIAKDMNFVEGMLSWRDGALRLDNLTLEEAASQFNRYNRRKLLIESKDIASMKIGGSFNPTNLDGFVRLLRDAYGLRIHEGEASIKISPS